VRQLSFGKMVQLGFDLLDLTHDANSAPSATSFKMG
jgi:hypothetical protein